MAKLATHLRVTKQFTFDMAHALWNYDGDCKNIHGHTYHLYVTVKGAVLQNAGHAQDGMVVDFSAIKQIVQQHIIQHFDHALVLNGLSPEHRNLSDALMQQFDKVIYLDRQPTCENLLLYCKDLLVKHLNSHLYSLVHIKLCETPTSYTERYEEDN